MWSILEHANVKSIDFNPNKQNQLTVGGEDGEGSDFRYLLAVEVFGNILNSRSSSNGTYKVNLKL